jgi:membrane associated rhomboid family serine protease
MTKGDSKDEYREVGENIRHWQHMRFTAMTVFIAVSAGLLAASFQWKANLTPMTGISVRLMGVLSVIIFWVQDERIVQYWKNFSARAKALEKELKFQQYSTMPPRNRLITSGNAIRLLYIMFFVFWAATLILYSQF